MEQYINNDLNNPKYLFHGSPKLLEIIEKREAHDSNNNMINNDYAVFLTSSFIIASAYAFKDKIKDMSSELNWSFNIGMKEDTKELFIKMNNVIIDDNIEGYIYVLPFDSAYKKDGIQYKCYKNVKPIEIIKVKFKDFKKYYTIT